GKVTKRELDQLLPDTKIVKELELQRSVGQAENATIFVLEMTPEAAEGVRERLTRNPSLRGVVFEEDAYVRLGAGVNRVEAADLFGATSMPINVAFLVVGKNDEPISDAEVSLVGNFGVARGMTGSDGQVQLR